MTDKTRVRCQRYGDRHEFWMAVPIGRGFWVNDRVIVIGGIPQGVANEAAFLIGRAAAQIQADFHV